MVKMEERSALLMMKENWLGSWSQMKQVLPGPCYKRNYQWKMENCEAAAAALIHPHYSHPSAGTGTRLPLRSSCCTRLYHRCTSPRKTCHPTCHSLDKHGNNCVHCRRSPWQPRGKPPHRHEVRSDSEMVGLVLDLVEAELGSVVMVWHCNPCRTGKSSSDRCCNAIR